VGESNRAERAWSHAFGSTIAYFHHLRLECTSHCNRWGTVLAGTLGVWDRSIIVIEDEPLIRWALAKEFATRGYRIETAGSAAEARRKIACDHFGIAVLTIHLPDDNGLNLLPSLLERDPSIRVIVISGDTTPGIKRRAFDEGAWQFIEKPFEVSEIANLLASIPGDRLDRRNHRRYCCRLPIRISVIEPLPEEAAMDLTNLGSTCFDVSTGGMRVMTVYPLRMGQRVKVVPLHPETFCARFITARTRAEVVWIVSAVSECTAGLRRLQTVTPDHAS
jgi:ActR/RegA family two-component response regulator